VGCRPWRDGTRPQRRIDRRVERLCGDLGDGILAQGAGAQVTSRSGSKQTAQLLGRRLGERTQGDEQHDRELLQAKSEMAEEAERLDVGPLRVVDRQQHGLLAGEVRAQPKQAVPLSEPISDRLRGVASSRGLRGKDRLGQRRGAGQPSRALSRFGCGELALE
jgi:hypothetical protein